MNKEIRKCPVCGGNMELYKTDNKKEIETDCHRNVYLYEEEHEVIERYNCVFYKCKRCNSILKESLLRRVILLKAVI